MRITNVVGTRPQLIKAAALLPALRRRHEVVLVDTGQHYDEAMAGVFFAELELPTPDHSLGVGGGSQAEQTARMLERLEPVLGDRPDIVVVYGDTNSTLAGALAASKLRIPIAHVEAGLRSFDRRMPEEINRVVADHLGRWLFAPTPTAVANLAAEGIREGVVQVGDLMKDLAARTVPGLGDAAALEGLALHDIAGRPITLRSRRYLFATVHRADNRTTDAVRRWVDLLDAVARPDRPVVLAIHPGTRAVLEHEGILPGPNVRIVEPQGYRTALTLQLHAAAILTDSGGVQREASWLRVPCLVLRDRTEWLEAVAGSGGRMVVVGLDVAAAVAELERLAPIAATDGDPITRTDVSPDGAADQIVAALEAGQAGA